MLSFVWKRSFQRSSTGKISRRFTTKAVMNSHCSYCGTGFQSQEWPRKCPNCQNLTFRNPIPVSVGLIPIQHPDLSKIGLLLVRRKIPPFAGELALPGGFVDWGESWQEGLSRELREETFLETDPNEFQLANTVSTPEGGRVLIFGVTSRVRLYSDLKNFKETDEVTELIVGDKAAKLCFSIHQQVFSDWFQKL